MYKLIFPFFAVLLISCKGTFKQPKFSVVSPKDWTRIDTIENNGHKKVSLTYFDSSNNFKSSIDIFYNKNESDDYIDKTIIGMQKNASKFKYENNGETEVALIKSKWVSFGMEYKTVPGMVEQTIYFIPFKEFVFVVFCIVPYGHLQDYQATINNVTESIRIF